MQAGRSGERRAAIGLGLCALLAGCGAEGDVQARVTDAKALPAMQASATRPSPWPSTSLGVPCGPRSSSTSECLGARLSA